MNTKYTIAACDLDGTILDGSRLSDANRGAVSELKQVGVQVVLTSGRNFHHVVPYHRGLELTSPVVSSDGALVSVPGGEILSERTLPEEAVVRVLAEASRRQITCLCYFRHGIHLTSRFDWSEGMERHREIGRRYRRAPIDTMMRKQVYKPLLYSNEPARLDDLQGEIMASFADAVDVIRNGPNTLEFIARGVSKVYGLDVLARHFGVEPSSALAFGDGVNDVGMFGWAGLSVSMHHGHPLAKSAARMVAPETGHDVNFAAAVKLALSTPATTG